ncbi:probable RNA methyltransferase At5g51130 [Primulina huaijiensis]|uniref:probable RNA methyltransferase At5g51130 n=1 Tax=Primulina huaijiensis TaxID=1492673 RepID=UPI003CC71E61
MVGENENNGSNRHSKSRKRSSDDKQNMEPKAAVTCSTAQESSKRRNKKEVAIFGNYRNYYGYRVGQDLDEDPRLQVMKGEWFEGKDCLDIGCNSGLITIAIAKAFGCRSILGVDIDGDRVRDAYWTLRKFVKTSTHNTSADAELVNGLKNHASESLTEAALKKDLLKIVSFQKGNFIQNWRPPASTYYSAVLCLSVTKWIHLNWGDDGLITLFRRVWTHLLPGGVFILEPQPWSSYYKNRLVSETAAANYKNIEIPPEDFQDILLDKIGFRRVENITSGLSGTKSGFDRPILAFWK